MSILLTGFPGYGGRDLNPTAEIVKALDGTRVEGETIQARVLTVSIRELPAALVRALEETRPALMLSLGLWPGEPLLRLERVGVNRADFEIPDNAGERLLDQPLDPTGPAARMASLPVGEMVTALNRAGIPARPSDSAGTFLCNATLYTALGLCEARGVRCGFLHVPYLPAQVAELLEDLAEEARLERHQRADLASMDLATQVEGVRLALATALGAGPR